MDDELFSPDDEAEAEKEQSAIAALRLPAEASTASPELPPVFRRIFGTEAEQELMAVAKLLDPAARKPLTLVFHTPIGDVRTPVNWSSCPPEHLHRVGDLLLVLVRSSSSAFSPNPGSQLDISFAEHSQQPRLRVTCLAPPMRLYAGVGVDLLVFLPHTDDMEKNGQLKEGAPSVVSGLPATRVSDKGEPLADGEDLEAPHVPVEDFDSPRES